MATKRIKDLTNTATSVASDSYLAIDGTSNGTEKITRDNFRQDTADAFVAAPGTYNLAPLSGGAVEVAKGGTGSTTADGARTNLEVNSTDEDAQANALKVTAPALYFDGSNDYVQVADDDKLSFTDGTDDLPFSVSAWVNMEDATNFTPISKIGTTASLREWVVSVAATDKLRLYVQDTAGNYAYRESTATLTSYQGSWIHLAWVYQGAGPNSSNSFSSSMDGVVLYLNGQPLSLDAGVYSGTYLGMSNTSQPVRFGLQSTTYSKGHIRGCKIFNRSLTASEVAELARGNDLGFADEFGGAHGAVYTSDFSAGVDGWSDTRVTSAGNIDAIGGEDDNLRVTITDTTNSTHSILKNVGMTAGKRYRLTADVYIPSGQSNVDGFRIGVLGDDDLFVVSDTPTLDSWVRVDSEAVASNASLLIYPMDGGVKTFQDSGGDDVLYLRNLKVTQLGTLADFRAERFDSSTSKLYDLSDNAFVGTGTSVSLTGREQPVYETGTWSPSVSFGGGSTGVATSIASGFYTRIGNLCHISCNLTLTSKGSDTGTAVITGLPFTAGSVSNQNGSIRAVYAANMAGLTSGIEGRTTDSSTDVRLQDWGAAGVAVLDDTNFTNTTSIRLGGWYQIQ